jgi:1,4-alpha-glucan branching enzyme
MENIQAQDLIQSALPGAMDHGQGWVTFALYAPGKRSVHLAGNFNNWNWQQDPMIDRGGGFWVAQKELPKGRYSYYYVIEGNKVICDPYSQEIEKMKKGSNACSAVEIGGEEFIWQHDDWQRPTLRDLIIYEINIGDFSPEGTFQGVLNKIDYLGDMDINAIELMPVYECASDDYWGYEPMYFLAPRRQFGLPSDLKQLIDKAHDRGLAVILDIVLAHTAQDHPLNQLYPYDQSPWYGESIGEKNVFGLPTLDYRKTATNNFARDIQYFWLKEFHVDGFRYDYLPAMGSEHSELGIPYLLRMARDIRPEAFLIGECLPENPDLVRDSLLSGVWHGRFDRGIECLLREQDIEPYKWDDFATAVEFMDPSKQDYNTADFMINYFENHDKDHAAEMLKTNGFSDDVISRKLALAATILLISPGEPMVYNGQEWGEATKKNSDPNPLHWDMLDSEHGRLLYNYYKAVCRLRRAHASLRSENITIAGIYSDQKSMVLYRWNGEMDQIVVAVNFSSSTQEFNVPFRRPGKWTEYFSREQLEIKNNPNLRFEPYSAKIFILGSD